MLDLGHHRQARRLIGQGTGLLPEARSKTRNVFLAYEAESFLRSGEIDQAATTVRRPLVRLWLGAHAAGAGRDADAELNVPARGDTGPRSVRP
ncbi:hypothetical protein [Streptomyces hesseae]|uniref:Uncharacterized protein n=1 Tax=Streptomyces hesseae TaxID=3075519 RepID=A0ABU2SLC8_9ACTN|nr:hypothetical protein [Streptomyces sp. DSM 40473]MDT0449431.1 hypothetical protein [Streptomyces sp. DSM 40473]